MALQLLITRSPEVMGGIPVFAGTRVPVQTLLDYLEGGDTIDDFLEGFPTVRREQVVAFKRGEVLWISSSSRAGLES